MKVTIRVKTTMKGNLLTNHVQGTYVNVTTGMFVLYIPYSRKFSQYENFAVFTDDRLAAKI